MKKLLVFALLASWAAAALGDDGMRRLKSAHGVQVTLDRLERIVTDKGFTVFARIDHAAGAAKVGKQLPPTQLLVFGNPAVGTALISASRTAGLDLPIRVLAWEDRSGQTWLGYTEPRVLADRHGIRDRDAVVESMTRALAALTGAAAGAQ